jgi:hypothetical protein
MLDLDAIFNSDEQFPLRSAGKRRIPGSKEETTSNEQFPLRSAGKQTEVDDLGIGVDVPFGFGPDDLPGDWRCEWEERAAIMEHDGKLPKERAEYLALRDILGQMQRAGVYPRR